jgi:TRL-like protein family
VLTVSCAVLFAGCAIGNGPVFAPVTINMKGPVSAGPAATGSKVGRSEAWGILVFATGDASISAAATNGGINRIHHVDHETMNILGILRQVCDDRLRRVVELFPGIAGSGELRLDGLGLLALLLWARA